MPTEIGAHLMRGPVWVYDNWSAYTDGFYKKDFLQLPDETRLTEELAMRQLQELARLKRFGVRFDYYMMNAFWFDPDGAYRTWRRGDWPDGPDRWIAACQEQGLKPGLWFGTNSLWKINPAPQWRDSLAPKREVPPGVFSLDTMSFHEGGFFPDFVSTLQHWYDRGIRLFEFDVADFDAATPAARRSQSPQEIRNRNQTVFSNALKDFRRRNPDVMLVAFNDFGGDIHSTATPFPFKKAVDLRWLDVFDTLYTGDVRVSDVRGTWELEEDDLWRSGAVERRRRALVCQSAGTVLTAIRYRQHQQLWRHTGRDPTLRLCILQRCFTAVVRTLLQRPLSLLPKAIYGSFFSNVALRRLRRGHRL